MLLTSLLADIDETKTLTCFCSPSEDMLDVIMWDAGVAAAAAASNARSGSSHCMQPLTHHCHGPAWPAALKDLRISL